MFEKQACIIELFGHQVIAGFVSDQAIVGASFIRVDVPAVDGAAAFTKFYGPSAIYAITPTDEATMLAAVKGYRVKPIDVYRLALPERATPTILDDPDDQDEDDEPCEGWNGDGM